MKKHNFKIRNISGGIARSSFTIVAADLGVVADELGGKIINSCPGWALIQVGFTSFEVSWCPSITAAKS
jgi:hypothetical protein